MVSNIRLAIVVPCYEEETVLEDTTSQLSRILKDLIEENLIAESSYILYVNDGSTDKTWPLIQELNKSNKFVKGVNLACNVGHQDALMAGITVAAEKCDAAISIDADLQDDVNVIKDMVIKYTEGCDIVYGVRLKRDSDSLFKRISALSFYSLLKNLGVKSVYNHADYRLMSKRALEQLLKYKERNLYLRGIVPTIGYKSDCVYYNRKERQVGESKYSFLKMLSLAFNGITSFSIKPIHLIIYLGIIFVLISILILCWVIYVWYKGDVVPGWSSLMLSIWFCSGCILISLGTVGEYIGKTYIEVKQRPRFNIEKILD